MNYICHILIVICIYVILGLSLNLVVGHAGLLSVCHAAFYGIGAYVSAMFITHLGWSFLPSLGVAILAGGLASFVVGLPSVRLKGFFFVLSTMAFQSIAYAVLYNWADLTGGPYGIANIPRPSVAGWRPSSLPQMLGLYASFAVLVGVLHWQLTRSPYGRALQTIREDEVAATTIGKNPFFLKMTAFVISGCIAALAGALYAGYATFIDPTSFGIPEAILILSIVIIGGAGSSIGPVVGAAVLTVLPEVMRLIDVRTAATANLQQVAYGILLILAMRFRPQGIAGRYAFD